MHIDGRNFYSPMNEQDLQLQVITDFKTINPLKEITYGAVSGMLGKLVEFPFDTIKVRLQSANPDHNLSTLGMIQKTYRNEGILNGFFKGLRTPLVGACLETSILFTTFNWSTAYLTNNLSANGIKYTDETLPFWCKCASGAFAGFAASFVLSPVELVKCQLQVSNLLANKNVGYGTLIKDIILKQNGLFGLWNGFSSTLVREVVGTAIWFGTYEYISDYFKKNDSYLSKDMQLLVAGASSGVAFNFSMYPIDTIKSNIQTNDILNPSKAGTGMWDITKLLVSRKGGILNLYRGLGITLIRAIPANALIFYTYEMLKRNF